MLTLPIKKKWFDMILSGEKKEEYREIKPYYDKRFGFIEEDKMKTYQVTRSIRFRNGYSKESPIFQCHVRITKGYGKKEWGADPNKFCYVLEIMNMEEIMSEEINIILDHIRKYPEKSFVLNEKEKILLLNYITDLESRIKKSCNIIQRFKERFIICFDKDIWGLVKRLEKALEGGDSNDK